MKDPQPNRTEKKGETPRGNVMGEIPEEKGEIPRGKMTGEIPPQAGKRKMGETPPHRRSTRKTSSDDTGPSDVAAVIDENATLPRKDRPKAKAEGKESAQPKRKRRKKGV